MPEIRPLTADDAVSAHAINEANVPEVGAVDLPALRRLMDLSSIRLGAVDDAGELLGFCLVLPPDTGYGSVNYRWFMERGTDVWYLDRVAFSAAAQRQGLGSRMYDEVEGIIRSEQPQIRALALEVNVDPPNPPSLAFHAGRGFVEVGRQATPYGIEVSMMEKPLR